jgi:hypothetical protein
VSQIRAENLLTTYQAVYTVFIAVAATGTRYGIGHHVADIPRQDYPKGMMYWWLGELSYTVTTVLLRLSISLFLLKICVNRSHKWIIWATMAGVAIFSTFYFLLAIFQCQPVSYFWNQVKGLKDGHCIAHEIFPNATYAHSAVSATADFILGLLPILIIWNLKMNLQSKISVGVVLSLGIM